ncbi:hypothetical protein [Streptomyces olivoreticuli]|uniref:hypothetical protein n=1 Tax=Streptomyces olivoreticuli TaxID=68246 RepID=UPI0013C2A5A7|nr:hypothetical protein [Streptomyces olivoreticuli]
MAELSTAFAMKRSSGAVEVAPGSVRGAGKVKRFGKFSSVGFAVFLVIAMGEHMTAAEPRHVATATISAAQSDTGWG